MILVNNQRRTTTTYINFVTHFGESVQPDALLLELLLLFATRASLQTLLYLQLVLHLQLLLVLLLLQIVHVLLVLLFWIARFSRRSCYSCSSCRFVYKSVHIQEQTWHKRD